MQTQLLLQFGLDERPSRSTFQVQRAAEQRHPHGPFALGGPTNATALWIARSSANSTCYINVVIHV
jgi:hypothetical protein